ncbi:kinase-like domain-containing protein [Dactylonectria estremocensis]|uniref:ethanolamine kinase n=1 Tax=Dactylonectria estremocensis TaxID=1079267 RepID=A0A9P9FEJ0_9HYPO|nr:kinase-like domain-containing protein [Dactylonectria estremocensis]
MGTEIPFAQHVFDATRAKHSVLQLESFLFLDSESSGDIGVTTLAEGTTNSLFKVSRQGTSPTGVIETVLIKVYGDGAEITIDRNKEITVHKLLSDKGLAPLLLVRFENGHAYQYLPGMPCSTEGMRNETVWRGVARELARWHATLPLVRLDTPEDVVQYKPSIWSTAKKWLHSLPGRTAEQRALKGQLDGEFQYVAKTLLSSGPPEPLVLGHGDLLSGNIIMQDSNSNSVPSIKFIDYEHATYCPPAFELANHFAEWTGFDCDYNLIPTTSTRRDFIREYLQTRQDLSKGQDDTDLSKGRDGTEIVVPSRVAEAEVERVMSEVDAFRGFPGFYWGLCALIQAEASTGSIDFDYAGYATKRLAEYWGWRGRDGTDLGKFNADVSLREDKWAAV